MNVHETISAIVLLMATAVTDLIVTPVVSAVAELLVLLMAVDIYSCIIESTRKQTF